MKGSGFIPAAVVIHGGKEGVTEVNLVPTFIRLTF